MNLITRTFATSLLALALQPAFAAQAAQPAKSADTAVAAQTASTITTVDGVQLYYKDWGPKDGPVVTFSHGWPSVRVRARALRRLLSDMLKLVRSLKANATPAP